MGSGQIIKCISIAFRERPYSKIIICQEIKKWGNNLVTINLET